MLYIDLTPDQMLIAFEHATGEKLKALTFEIKINDQGTIAQTTELTGVRLFIDQTAIKNNNQKPKDNE